LSHAFEMYRELKLRLQWLQIVFRTDGMLRIGCSWKGLEWRQWANLSVLTLCLVNIHASTPFSIDSVAATARSAACVTILYQMRALHSDYQTAAFQRMMQIHSIGADSLTISVIYDKQNQCTWSAPPPPASDWPTEDPRLIRSEKSTMFSEKIANNSQTLHELIRTWPKCTLSHFIWPSLS